MTDLDLRLAEPPEGPTDMASSPDISRLMRPQERAQSLRGFDPDYADIVDYIIRSTHKIWEERGVGRIYDHYRHNAIIHMTDGLTYGRDQVIADSMATMNAFPDIRLYGDEVIWSGNDEDGFHTSHRITWVGRNTGFGKYGPPTLRKVVRRGIAHCLVKENRVVEEWICRDELAVVRQLGLNEREAARTFARIDAARFAGGASPPSLGEGARTLGQNGPEEAERRDDEPDIEFAARAFWQDAWNRRRLDLLRVHLAPNHVAWGSTNRRLDGLGEYAAWVLSILTAFPDGAMTVDHVCSTGARVALRWTFQGAHLGPGWYGAPTGRRVKLMGITHLERADGRFAQEWTIFDEFALLKQLVDVDGV